MGYFSARVARPVVGALGAVAVPFVPFDTPRPAACESKPFSEATCVKNEKHTHDTRKITLSLATPWTTQGAIGNVLVRLQKDVRPYNPLSAESGSELTLLVKRYPEAKVGGALHELKPGDSVEVRGPNQQWSFEKGKYNHYAMLAGGTGITPLFQTAGHVLSNDPAAQVTMVTLNKTSDDILLRPELAELQATHGKRLKVVHVTEIAEGRASAAMLKNLLPAPKGKVLVMVCGRPGMTEAIAGAKNKDYTQGEVGGFLKELGYSKDQVWKV